MHPWIARTVVFSLLGTVTAWGQEITPSPQAQPVGETKPSPELAAILADWEAADQQINSLMLTFVRTDRSGKWGDQVFQGQAVYKSPGQVCLEFRKAVLYAQRKPIVKVDTAGNKVMEVEPQPFQRIVLTKDRLLQFEWDEQAVYLYPRTNQGRLGVLQEGPVPFLFDMKAADAPVRYEMTLLAQTQKPDDYLISIVPRNKTDRDSFNRAFVYLNKKTFLPSMVILYPVGDKDKQEFRFTNIHLNQPVDDVNFHPPTAIPGWKVVDGSGSLGFAESFGRTAKALTRWIDKATTPPEPTAGGPTPAAKP